MYNLELFNKLMGEAEYITVDVETELIDKDVSLYKKTPKFVVGGYSCSFGYRDTFSSVSLVSDITSKDKRILVGHNIKFDLQAIGIDDQHIEDHFIVWDTGIYTYMASGQTETWSSLEDSLLYFGLGHLTKSDEVAKAIKSGVCPSTMEPLKLGEYLKQDVEITEALFEEQHKHFVGQTTEFQNLVLLHMYYSTLTLRMSRHGLRIDKEEAHEEKERMLKVYTELHLELCEFMRWRLPDTLAWEISPASPKQIGLVLAGGSAPTKTKVPVGRYKTGAKKGQIKYSNKDGIATVEPLIPMFAAKDLGTSESDLKKWRELSTSLRATEFINKLLEFRSLQKDLKTYYSSYLDSAGDDGILQPQYNHCVTPTGRISCTKPNLMNLPK
jgi:DNA polymerase I-like protein with 3'-5' exonuclease and polymerase domains